MNTDKKSGERGGLWINSEGTREGKYLTVRRDGTIPVWPSFTFAAKDPAAPAGLRAYAMDAEDRGFHRDYVRDIRALADAFEAYCRADGEGDPDGRPHRKDDPRVIRLMREGGHVFAGMGPALSKDEAQVLYEAAHYLQSGGLSILAGKVRQIMKDHMATEDGDR